MMYIGPLLLVLSIWGLSIVELKKDNPNGHNMLFYKVIAGSFTIMQFFVMPVAQSSLLDVIISVLISLVSAVITVFICLPKGKLPIWYKERLQIPTNKAINDTGADDEEKTSPEKLRK
ncbi:hypothetical protein EYB33_12170 [Lysinibacillus sphaericus]|uniref:hypothetical protein n=1 Tax=Lysinibacillus TaxID=400634 RepID=UPI00084BA06F|nr:hypothetical protein [Lysinibacillus sphaericus]OEC01277.1 hypothetical protein GY31_13305 [Lysinibacillus sphaericus]UDK97016.1 hypothetical protein EYB33_12170 [Lysinibacillus sphaericus]